VALALASLALLLPPSRCRVMFGEPAGATPDGVRHGHRICCSAVLTNRLPRSALGRVEFEAHLASAA